MSLRHQIYLNILNYSLGILLLGGCLTIWQAQESVKREVESTINLTVQLVRFGVSQQDLNESSWLKRINTINQTRHLHILVQSSSGQILPLPGDNTKIVSDLRAPHWFARLVGGNQKEAKQTITTKSGTQYILTIKANPLDEISEIWRDSIATFGLIVLLMVLTFLAVHFAFNKTIGSIAVIINTLKLIETGDYHQQLPAFDNQEYDQIANAINHMTGELNKAQQEYRTLMQHSLDIQEDERRHLAQELHDEFGQYLTAIKVMAVSAAKKSATPRDAIDTITGICDHLMGVVRSMMRQLHPLILSELGLKAALEDLLDHWRSKQPELVFKLNCPSHIDQISPKLAIQIFRIIQECITNIIRHAGADTASIDLKICTEPKLSLVLVINDNGCGCTDDQLQSGFGLQSMKQRIKSMGGSLTIDSAMMNGMCIKAWIPL